MPRRAAEFLGGLLAVVTCLPHEPKHGWRPITVPKRIHFTLWQKRKSKGAWWWWRKTIEMWWWWWWRENNRNVVVVVVVVKGKQ